MTKSEIVQRLLDNKSITAEEAVVLLMENPPIINVPNTYPVYPTYPTLPYTPGQPYWQVTCSSSDYCSK